MGSVKPPSWYDDYYTTAPETKLSWRETTWRPLYEWALTKVVPSDFVLGLGCGCGPFAQALHDIRVTRYHGFDFSAVAIAEARRRCPEYLFTCADILDCSLPVCYTVAVAIEVLEHIEGDVIGRLDSGVRFVGSLPTFDCAQHVFHCETEGQVRDAVESRLTELHIQRIESWWGFTGKVR